MTVTIYSANNSINFFYNHLQNKEKTTQSEGLLSFTFQYSIMEQSNKYITNKQNVVLERLTLKSC